MLTLCCICHEIITPGNEDISKASHGYCLTCMKKAMAENGCTKNEINQVVESLNDKRDVNGENRL